MLLLGAIVGLGLAYTYLRYTKPVYEVRARVLIETEDENTSILKIINQDQGNNQSSKLNTDIEIMKSTPIMEGIVKQLGLDVKYFVEGKVISRDLYKTSNSCLLYTSPSPRDS